MNRRVAAASGACIACRWDCDRAIGKLTLAAATQPRVQEGAHGLDLSNVQLDAIFWKWTSKSSVSFPTWPFRLRNSSVLVGYPHDLETVL
jgi:hypothetical protein